MWIVCRGSWRLRGRGWGRLSRGLRLLSEFCVHFQRLGGGSDLVYGVGGLIFSSSGDTMDACISEEFSVSCMNG